MRPSELVTTVLSNFRDRLESAGADRTWRLVVEQYPHHLGHSPHLDEGKAETALEQAVKLRFDAGAKTEANCMIPLFDAQLLTYMKLANVRLGLLINFNVPLIKNGIKRKVL